MGWQTTTDVHAFLDTAGDFLRSRPVEHTVPLTVTANPVPADALFGSFHSEGQVTGVFIHTPPFPVWLTGMPPGAAAELAAVLADRPQPGINARPADADAYAEVWSARTGGVAEVRRTFRLFLLSHLIDLPAPPGRARVATVADRALLIDWFARFHTDIGEPRDDYAADVDAKLSYGGMWLWENDGSGGGEPVAMAGMTRPESGMARVLAVYTPPASRSRGYGGAVTHAVTRAALAAGATDIVLYTDLANPTSNALYPRLGYRPVEDRNALEFTR